MRPRVTVKIGQLATSTNDFIRMIARDYHVPVKYVIKAFGNKVISRKIELKK
jgi:hypothetical protein